MFQGMDAVGGPQASLPRQMPEAASSAASSFPPPINNNDLIASEKEFDRNQDHCS